ncbi:MAG: four helix bundle protein [Clostridia bacterium]|nr:four helix bundle protein [Clostridia bacterium]
MKENLLVDLSKKFAVDIVNVCSELQNMKREYVLANQLLHSGTSIGENIHEANYASSRADFINKLQIALKECYETEYWLDLFKETGIISEEAHTSLYSQCCKIRKLLTASINTAKDNME